MERKLYFEPELLEMENNEFLEFLEHRNTKDNSYIFDAENEELETEVSKIEHPEELIEGLNNSHNEYPDWEVEIGTGLPAMDREYTATARYQTEGEVPDLEKYDHLQSLFDEELDGLEVKYAEPGELTIEGKLSRERMTGRF